MSAPRLITASTPGDESRRPPKAESTSVPDEEVASTPVECQRAHPAIGDVNRIPECGWTKHSCCSEVEIEDIGTSPTRVSQQAEQVRVVTGQRATRKDDRSRREIVLVCRRSESRTELRVESPRDYDYNPES